MKNEKKPRQPLPDAKTLKASSANEIAAYIHCGKCVRDKPADVSPREYQWIQVGWTRQGLQVWCVRHDVNIAHIDFEGQLHPANLYTLADEMAAAA